MIAPSPRLVAERDARLAALGSYPPWWRVLARRRWHHERAAILAMDVSQYSEMLRSWYSDDRIQDLARSTPSYAMLKRTEPQR